MSGLRKTIRRALATRLAELEADPDDIWTCPDCGRQWTALEEAHCAGCCRHFSSDSAFDKHLIAPPQGPRPFKTCRDPAALHKADGSPRLIQVETDHGSMWAWPEMAAEIIALRSKA